MTRISMTLAADSMTLSLVNKTPKPDEITKERRAGGDNTFVLFMLRRGYLSAT